MPVVLVAWPNVM